MLYADKESFVLPAEDRLFFGRSICIFPIFEGVYNALRVFALIQSEIVKYLIGVWNARHLDAKSSERELADKQSQVVANLKQTFTVRLAAHHNKKTLG